MSESDFCPECRGKRLIMDPNRGELVCSDCGVVSVIRSLDNSPEWRAYDSEEESSRSRVGAPLSLLNPDLGLQTQISSSHRDGQGRQISSQQRMTFRRLSSIDSRTQQSALRNLRIALRELKRIKSQLELPDDTAQTAAMIYRKSLKENLVRGRTIDGMIAASMYLACRRMGLPQTLKDIAQVANVHIKELGRCVRILISELDMKPSQTDLPTLIHRLAEELNITMYTRRIAVEILNEAKSSSITVGKNPMSMAAAALYIAGVRTGERRTQQQVAKAAKTTPVTIRNRFKELVQALKIENVEVKRGAAAIPVYATDPLQFQK
ncbi:MAG: transcription initiation factor IIB family protein [Candidatus Hodarchaeota archaeon]